jgi:hypothetical protein
MGSWLRLEVALMRASAGGNLRVGRFAHFFWVCSPVPPVHDGFSWDDREGEA